jgi:hypothetical protein
MFQKSLGMLHKSLNYTLNKNKFSSVLGQRCFSECLFNNFSQWNSMNMMAIMNINNPLNYRRNDDIINNNEGIVKYEFKNKKTNLARRKRSKRKHGKKTSLRWR